MNIFDYGLFIKVTCGILATEYTLQAKKPSISDIYWLNKDIKGTVVN